MTLFTSIDTFDFGCFNFGPVSKFDILDVCNISFDCFSWDYICIEFYQWFGLIFL